MAKKRQGKRPASGPDTRESRASDEKGGDGAGLLGQVRAAGVRFARAGSERGSDAADPAGPTQQRAGSAADSSHQRAVAEATQAWAKDSLLLAELGTFLWYLKTRHFKKDWDDAAPDSEDATERRTLTRMRRGVEALEAGGITIEDPTGRRYPDGGEGWAKPVQITPTPGIDFAVITDTLKPIVYRNERLIQRGEVFVASPVIDEDDVRDTADGANETIADTEELDDESND